VGHFILRVVAGLMIFYIHGWHKTGRLDCLAPAQHALELAEEVAEMHFPASLASAAAATLVQFLCSLFIIVGLFTRISAALLAGRAWVWRSSKISFRIAIHSSRSFIH